jgi:peptidoglycan L-alanyl-D-glutamate endopeptidase CwlK
MQLDLRSIDKLKDIHQDLRTVIRTAALIHDEVKTGWGFVVTEGLRTLERQRQLVAGGASKTLKSRHLTGHAVDLAVYLSSPKDIRWDWPLYSKLSALVKMAAVQSGIPIEWGGDWKTFKDGPHFQLPQSKYP